MYFLRKGTRYREKQILSSQKNLSRHIARKKSSRAVRVVVMKTVPETGTGEMIINRGERNQRFFGIKVS